MKIADLMPNRANNIANNPSSEDVQIAQIGRRKRGESGNPRKKNPFTLVNERYARNLARQVNQSRETKRAVSEKAIKETEGITLVMYLFYLRTVIFNKLLPNLKFQSDCIELGLEPFVAAQNIAMAGAKQVDLVLNQGIDNVYKNNTELLKDEIYTELEMAQAKYNSIVGSASEWQCTEAKRLTQAVREVLGLMKTQGEAK